MSIRMSFVTHGQHRYHCLILTPRKEIGKEAPDSGVITMGAYLSWFGFKGPSQQAKVIHRRRRVGVWANDVGPYHSRPIFQPPLTTTTTNTQVHHHYSPLAYAQQQQQQPQLQMVPDISSSHQIHLHSMTYGNNVTLSQQQHHILNENAACCIV
jgi:hypothetical protein